MIKSLTVIQATTCWSSLFMIGNSLFIISLTGSIRKLLPAIYAGKPIPNHPLRSIVVNEHARFTQRSILHEEKKLSAYCSRSTELIMVR